VPLKTCPECGTEHGPRKKECDCGYAFVTKSNHPLVPEPGGWVLDTERGMPKIGPPEPLPKGQLDTEAVRDHVAYEGLGFCIYSLIPASRIKDRRLRKLWSDARAAMQKVQEHIYNVHNP
jgi:hypothetical protein